MSNLPVLSGNNNQPKFLMTSEKIGRGAVGLGIAAALVVVGNAVLPSVITFIELATITVGRGIVLAGLLFLVGSILAILFNPRTVAALWYAYWGLSEKFSSLITGQFISKIDRLKAYVHGYLIPTRDNIQRMRDRAKGRAESASTRYDQNQAGLADSQKRAQYILEHGSSDGGHTWEDSKARTNFRTESQKINTLNKAAGRLLKRRDLQFSYVKILDELLSVMDSYIEVTSFNVKMLIEEYESAGEMAEGAREVRSALGASEKKRIFDETAEQMQLEINTWMSEIEGVVNTLKHKIDEGKIGDAIAEQELISQLQGRVGQISSFAESQRQVAASGQGGAVILDTARSKVLEAIPVRPQISGESGGSRYDKFLNK